MCLFLATIESSPSRVLRGVRLDKFDATEDRILGIIDVKYIKIPNLDIQPKRPRQHFQGTCQVYRVSHEGTPSYSHPSMTRFLRREFRRLALHLTKKVKAVIIRMMIPAIAATSTVLRSSCCGSEA